MLSAMAWQDIYNACSNSDYLISQSMHPVQMLAIEVVHCGVGETHGQGQ
jgi:hypothetical protein